MAFPNIATVNLTLLTSAVASANFGTPMFITTHRNFIERVREYNSADDVLEDFGVSSAAYKAAQAFFSPTPKPSAFKVGRQAADVSLAISGAVAEDDVFGLYISSGTNTTALVSYTAVDGDDVEEVVDELVASLDSLFGSTLTITKVGTGGASTIRIVPDAVLNNFAIGELVNLTMTLTASETIVEAKAAITEEDSDYYFTTSQYRDSTNVLALANAVEAEERMYFVASGESASLGVLPDSPTDVLGLLKAENLSRTATLFHHTAASGEYPELSYIGRFCTYEPGTIDWYAKNLGISVSLNPLTGTRVSSTQQNNLQARNASAVVLEGGQPIIKMGYVVDGEKIDNIRFRDFYAARLREAYQNWRINSNKIPFDQIGIDSAESVFRSVSERYVSTPDRPHAITSYVTNFPRREDVSFADVSAGTLRAQATVYLTGSIFTVVLDGVLTYDAEF